MGKTRRFSPEDNFYIDVPQAHRRHNTQIKRARAAQLLLLAINDQANHPKNQKIKAIERIIPELNPAEEYVRDQRLDVIQTISEQIVRYRAA